MTSLNVKEYHWNNWIARKNKYSPCGEELVIEFFSKYLPIINKTIIEITPSFVYSKVFSENGYKVKYIPNIHINRENIMSNLQNQFPEILIIDLEGNDLYVIDEILNHLSPILIMLKTNQIFPLGESKTIIYDPNFIPRNDIYFGASVTAMDKMLSFHNYLGIHLCATSFFAIPSKYYSLLRQYILPISYSITETKKMSENIKKFIEYCPSSQILTETIDYPPTRRNFRKYPHFHFVESNTYLGEGIKEAIMCKFDKCTSFEKVLKLYENANKIFGDRIVLGQMTESFVKKLNNDTLFWLDAINSEGKEGFNDLKNELEIIKSTLTSPTILINNFRIIENLKKEVIDLLLSINQNYRIEYENGFVPNGIFVAHIPFISVKLIGGLCNQLFQIMYTFAVGFEFDMNPIFEHVEKLEPSGTGIVRHTYWDGIFKKITTISNDRYKYIPFENIKEGEEIPKNKNSKLHGYFQTISLINKHRDKILSLLSLPNMKDKLETIRHFFQKVEKVIAIHIRRNDYIELKHIHTNQSIEYYKQATKLFNEDKDLFLIFTDDLPWCKENITWLKNIYFIVENEENSLSLMKECDHFIIANSSFSYMGMWLCENKNKKGIMSSKWFENVVMNKVILENLKDKFIEIL